MNYVVAAYTITVVLIGLYAWSIHARRKALESELDEHVSERER